MPDSDSKDLSFLSCVGCHSWPQNVWENDLYQNNFATLKFIIKCPNFVKFSGPDREGTLGEQRKLAENSRLESAKEDWLLRLNLTFLQNSNFRLKIFSS